jgi:hypothetical protein
MSQSTRRKFLHHLSVGLGTAALAGSSPIGAGASSPAAPELESKASRPEIAGPSSAIDFRYSPLSWRTVYCFPDDEHKSLVGDHGDLLYWNPGRPAGAQYFPQIVEFSLLGMEADELGEQRLESPEVPIIHTRLDRPEAFLQITTFATRHVGEGRVDNVILQVVPRTAGSLTVVPLVLLKTKREAKLQTDSGVTVVRLDDDKSPPFLLADAPLVVRQVGMVERQYRARAVVVSEGKPFRCFLRLPQEGQEVDKLREGLAAPQQLLAEAREFWQSWKACEGEVSAQIPGPQGDFLVACARNIQQAREEKAGKLAFEVGPTVYRVLAVVDGHFLLEAARYLGYDAAAQQGLESTWNHQEAAGGVFAAAGHAHWKDTGIALFTLVRQAELSRDWSYFRAMQPQMAQAVKFLMSRRDQARSEGSANGRYGLLAAGYGDGGLPGIHSEFTNTVWVLAGLKAVVEAADRLGLPDPGGAKQFYQELRAAFFAAARQEMRHHPDGFAYLPMLAKEDPLWSAPDDWDRPRPQTAQWALSHAIYPGLVFDRNDPVVQGHISLMQACTQEDIPAETGWLPHGGLWPYNGAFVAQVYLWAGLTDWARGAFHGFLNHASPLYCWWEEQPLRGSLSADLHGDMPHNWASAEVVLYLRHMLALEDGQDLRLLAGIGDFELASGQPLHWLQSPTRFGRIDVSLEPLDARKGWRLKFQKGTGPAPATLQLPDKLGSQWRFAKLTGAAFRQQGHTLFVTPTAAAWEAEWKAIS